MDHRTVMDLAGTDAAAYIRKSRLEEGMDTQEVLSKHQKALVEYAAAHQIHLIEIYPEVVSGESLYARPQMLRLLQDVEEGRYDAVLCMDLDRLSRGRMKDQGIILDTFRESDTLIITPEKVYDLSDDIDEEYAELKKHGLNGVICFQETYNKARYNVYHPRGMKSKFEWRVNGFDRMGQAGVHSIGMGVLIGLEEWRTDVTMMAYHLRYLQKKYWKTKYSVNFPRMRPAENGGFQPNVIMNDRELAQLTFAMRIFDHDVDISYSTREPAHIRDNMAGLGVTTMSAESKTEPGGYYTYPQALEQFHVSDERTAVEVERALKSLGREPVWKDWDASFDQFASTR